MIKSDKEILERICLKESEFYYRFTVNQLNIARKILPKINDPIREKKTCRIKDCGGKRIGEMLCSKHLQRKRAKERGSWRSGKGRTSKFIGKFKT